MPTPSTGTKPNYLGPFITMVIMMTVIGFVTSINQQFQLPIKSAYLHSAGGWTNSFATLLIFAFFLSYLVLGPTSARFVERHGYKMTIVRGLVMLAGGILLFILSALLFMHTSLWITLSETVQLPVSYLIFLLGSFVCGAGITFMQSSVNPYLIACTVPGTSAVQRQNIGGVGNSTMTMLAPLFVSMVIFGGVDDLEALQIQEVIVPMIILMGVVLILSYIVKRLHVPHIEGTTSGEDAEVSFKTVWRIRRVRLGCIALFCYVGVEVCIGANIILYGQNDLSLSYSTVALYATLYWGAMLVGRFVGSFLNRVSDRKLLWSTTLLSAILILIAVVTNQPYWLIAVGLCHSVMWGAIYSLALKELGSLATRASGVLLMGLIGGALLPFVQSLLADLLGGYHYTWLLVVAGELYMLYYALVGSRFEGGKA